MCRSVSQSPPAASTSFASACCTALCGRCRAPPCLQLCAWNGLETKSDIAGLVIFGSPERACGAGNIWALSDAELRGNAPMRVAHELSRTRARRGPRRANARTTSAEHGRALLRIESVEQPRRLHTFHALKIRDSSFANTGALALLAGAKKSPPFAFGPGLIRSSTVK